MAFGWTRRLDDTSSAKPDCFAISNPFQSNSNCLLERAKWTCQHIMHCTCARQALMLLLDLAVSFEELGSCKATEPDQQSISIMTPPGESWSSDNA